MKNADRPKCCGTCKWWKARKVACSPPPCFQEDSVFEADDYCGDDRGQHEYTDEWVAGPVTGDGYWELQRDGSCIALIRNHEMAGYRVQLQSGETWMAPRWFSTLRDAAEYIEKAVR